jgi:hypothetical protein
MGLPVRFHCKDGEIIVGELHSVSEDETDVSFDLVSSNRQERYQVFGDCAFRLAFDEIDSVTLPDSPDLQSS